MPQIKSILGTRIRERRKELRISQSKLAQESGISASYLNLIEHNKRSIGGALLMKVAEGLDIELEELEDAGERRLHSLLSEIAHIPNIKELGVENERIGELIGRFPGWSRALHTLARSEQDSASKFLALADRLTHDSYLADSMQKILAGISSIRSATEILREFPDMKPKKTAQFQEIGIQESQKLTSIIESLVSYLEHPTSGRQNTTPINEVETLFESHQNRFEEIEDLANLSVSHSRTPNRFEKANGSKLNKAFITAIESIVNHQSGLNTEIARSHALESLKTYAIESLKAPMNTFEQTAKEHGYDVESIANTLSISLTTVCHRLTALPKATGIPEFGYLLANASGTIISVRHTPDLAIPRFSSACPLWVIFRAQQSPETIIRQRAIFPNGDSFIFLARARNQGETGFGKPRHYLTDMLIMSEASAESTVYAPRQAVPQEPVGVSCRSCPRKGCIHRVTDPLTG
jgi:predicted transcriptional regulator/transcriptional regulator with XRE-family HTH domain